jgi:ribosomal protein L16 Arg81 hydroxylase
MMWIGPAGTFTPLHFDLTNNLIVQVVGTKKVIMSPPSQTQRLYNYRHVFSAVHDITDEGQLARYPLARGAQTIEIDLHAGEILFVPIGWWHQVTALDFSVTLTHTNFRWPNEGHESFPRG